MVRVCYSNKFSYSTSQLADQYYHIYNVRLRCAREALIKSARFRWGEEVKNVPLEQLNAALGNDNVFVIGTLFKSMPKQRSILKELEGDERPNDDANVNFTSEEDSLILHETDENVQLVGDIDIDMHVTGIPVALLGCQLNGGAKFHVSDICYAGPSLDVYKPTMANHTNGNSKHSLSKCILIVSGFEFGLEPSRETILGLKKLRSFVLGRMSECENINGHSESRVVKIIIAGNSVGISYAKDSKAVNGVKALDRYLFELAQSGADITLMPGRNDPSSFLMPQQPFHPKILQLSGSLKNVRPTTNPCSMVVDNYQVLGTSGENVDAIRQHSKIEYSTTILKNALEWGHIAPSAPDNLSCLPFKDMDPLLIDTVPDILFAGNQPEFGVTTYSCEGKKKIQLISVPGFAKTRSCVLVDLADLDCELISF